MATLGKRNRLSIIRESVPGLYLNGGELGEILLPKRYIPAGLKQGDTLDVFVYRDSEDRLVATTEMPRAMVGEFACLRVLSVNARVGAFLDWGLSKDLLLPFREQERPARKGQNVVVFVYADPKSQRIVASSRLKRHLSPEPPNYRAGQKVSVMITGATPLGFQAIVENQHLGLLYRDRVTAPLQIGQQLEVYVRNVRADDQIDLSLDLSGYKRVAPLTQEIISALERNGGRLAFDDDSSPESIRQTFGVSKKAFKQALGKLYKTRRIRFTQPGIELMDNSRWTPGQ